MMKKIEEIQDRFLLRVYMLGFDHELEPVFKTPVEFRNKMNQTAYDLGRVDALIGDDVSSSDLQTNDEILEKIKRNNIQNK